VKQEALFGGARLQMTDSIRLTIESLLTYGPRHQHWAIAWSGGKDSTTLVTLVVWLLLVAERARRGETIINEEITALLRQLRAPKTLTVLYADTRMELLPLWFAAAEIRDELAEHAPALAALGFVLDVRTVMAPLDDRFLVYMLGRGVPPSNNRTFRWCTPQIKIEPMEVELAKLAADRLALVPSTPPLEVEALPDKILMLTGVRVGESAARDQRIALSCSRDGGECGQGWYQETLPGALCDTLAPSSTALQSSPTRRLRRRRALPSEAGPPDAAPVEDRRVERRGATSARACETMKPILLLLALVALSGCLRVGGIGEPCRRDGQCDHGLRCVNRVPLFSTDDDWRCVP
jgi:3'-phosphoadenosine 5'-phosphosulfate sulfotransferase (PAPS reductase)/FAD synthetase